MTDVKRRDYKVGSAFSLTGARCERIHYRALMHFASPLKDHPEHMLSSDVVPATNPHSDGVCTDQFVTAIFKPHTLPLVARHPPSFNPDEGATP